MKRLIIILLYVCVAMGVDYSGDTEPSITDAEWEGPTCEPANFTVDGSGYCSMYVPGWGGNKYTTNGYSTVPRPGANPNSELGRTACRYLSSKPICPCPECIYLNAIAPDACGQHRCDDNTGYYGSDEKCYSVNSDGTLSPSTSVNYVGCYKRYNPCRTCELGKYLLGCKRASKGECVDCPGLPSGYYYTASKGCVSAACSVASAGTYASVACTSFSDAVITPCTTYDNGRKQYYCPGGPIVDSKLIPLSVPANAESTSDFSGWQCKEGYYRTGDSCTPCPSGRACKFGRSYACPKHYYQDSYGSSFCKRCRSQCDTDGYVPKICEDPAGTTSNLACVPCTFCGVWPSTGRNCLIETSQLLILKTECSPLDVQDETKAWNCISQI